MTAEVAIALGSNLGDRVANLRAAVRYLRDEGLAVGRFSSVWETAPVPADQPAFLNAAVAATTSLAPLELLALLKEIEYWLGRRPSRRWGPRPIDLDLLFYGDERIELPELTVPHPRIAERSFVLVPLGEVMPGPLPVLGKSASELLSKLGPGGLVRRRERLD